MNRMGVGLLLAATAMLMPVGISTAQDAMMGVRVDKLEKEMRAVQRKVFPTGAGATLDPQIPNASAPVTAAGSPASAPLTDLTGRVDALEKQLATITGQVEQQDFRIRKLEEAMASRAGAPVTAAAPASTGGAGGGTVTATAPKPAASSPATKPPATAAAPKTAATSAPTSSLPPAGGTSDVRTATGDPAEDGYLAGYDQWEAKDYAGAEKTLSVVATKYPKHRRYSYAQNLLGRAYLDEGKPVTAAKVFLENYRTAPQGERAADSLYFLGVSLIQLKKLPDACKSFDELQAVYGATMRDYLKERLPAARKEAQCK